MPSTISAGTTAGTAIAIAGDTTGNLAFQTNGTTTAMTINTSQQVGIGTTTPTANTQLDVVSADTSQQYVDVLRLKTTNTGDFHPAILLENNRNSVQNACKIVSDSGSTAGSGFLGFRLKNSGGTFVTMGGFASGGEFLMNSGYGSAATAYGCRSWVNFNGTTSPGTIRASGNVTSVTKNGTGDYTVNFNNSMPDNNYAVAGTCVGSTSNAFSMVCGAGGSVLNTGSVRFGIIASSTGTQQDYTFISISIFR